MHSNHGRRKSPLNEASNSSSQPHPTMSALSAIVQLPQTEWLSKLSDLKWSGSERINIEKWKSTLTKLKEPINGLNVCTDKHNKAKKALICAILNIFSSLIIHASRQSMHHFDILSIESLQTMIDLDDINILLIVLSVWTSFSRRSGGQIQFEHDQLKKKILVLCCGIFQTDFSVPIPSILQQNNLTKMSALCTPQTTEQTTTTNSAQSEFTEFAQTIKIPKEYHIEQKSETVIVIKTENEIDAHLQSLKKIIRLSSEKWFELKWRMLFGAKCNDLAERQNFIRLRLKALLVLSTFCANNQQQQSQHPLVKCKDIFTESATVSFDLFFFSFPRLILLNFASKLENWSNVAMKFRLIFVFAPYCV